MKTLLSRLTWLLAGLTLLSACQDMDGAKAGPVVLAASSLQESLEAVAAAWTAQGHLAPVLSFAASSALARQIEQGAPADMFLSADEEWMDALQGQMLLRDGTRQDLLTNRLVVVRPRGSGIGSFADLGQGKLALADPAAVPAGRYAREALENMGLWGELERKVVPAENVRAALALVDRGEAMLGIVYATDALAATGVEVVQEIPGDMHAAIRYPVAVLASSRNADAAAFRAFLGSDQAQRIFVQHGFGHAQ
jgi:molybdate transport system substrate-binding protein